MQTVLIIDDDANYRRVLAEALTARGWLVREASNGKEGVAIAKQLRPQLVLCDLMMPDGNGFQVCRALRAAPSLKRTRIVVTSGRDFTADRKAAREAGADEYLTKPLSHLQIKRLFPRPKIEPAAATTSPASLRFWGVRGSIPTPGRATARYGGNTTCVEVRVGEEIIVLDGGTGLRGLGKALIEEFKDRPLSLTLLLSHTHWDHIQGLPFFLPLYEPKNHIRVLGYEGARQGLKTILGNQMENPYFPVGLDELPSNVRIQELNEMSFSVGAVRVEACFANHPGVCVGYRLFAGDRSLAFFPDNEPRLRQHVVKRHRGAPTPHDTDFARREDHKLVDFLHSTDVLIMDTQYDCAEYREHVGWGHGCVEDVVDLALTAEVKRLFLFHHDPDHDDAKVTSMLRQARQRAAAANRRMRVDAAREGMTIQWER